MTCTSCGDQPRKDRAFPSAVVEINNPEQLILLRKVVLPATLTEADNPPTIGKYRNVVLKYEDTGNVYIYSSDGIPTAIEANVPQEILDKIADLEDGLEDETTAREAADTRLETAISGLTDALATETTARTTADATLDTRIDGVSSALSTETTAREAADTALGTRIDGVASSLAAEITARSTADTAIRSDLTTLTNRVTTAEGDIDTIEGKIPNQATTQNQLADKNFVNSSIATNTANFIGTFNSVAELEAYSGTVTNNDYAFVIVTDAQGNTAYDRYKYSGDTEQWMFEYELNNSSFTAVQWAAINSGITSGNVDKLTGLANIKTIGANLSLSQTGELSATDTTYTAGNGLSLNGTLFSVDTTTIATQSDLTTGLATKQNTLTAGSNIQINNDTISATDTTYSDFVGTDGTSAGTSGLVPAPTAADTGKVLGADGAWVTGGPTVVQTKGNSTTDVMSQAATTSLVYADIRPSYYGSLIRIGYNASNTSNILYEGIAIGANSKTTGNYGVALGTHAWVEAANGIAIGGGSGTQTAPRIRAPYSIAIGDRIDIESAAPYSVAIGTGGAATGRSILAKGSVSLGAFSKATSVGEMNIGLSEATAEQQTTYGYNGSEYRLLTGLYDGQNAHDAVTKGQLDSAVTGIESELDSKQDVLTAGDNITIQDESGDLVISATDTTYTAGTGINISNGVISATSTGPTVVQTTGSSTTDVMSQNAVTDLIYTDDTYYKQIAIGTDAQTGDASNGNAYSVAIGTSANAGIQAGSSDNAAEATAIGSGAVARGKYGTAIGSHAKAGQDGVFRANGCVGIGSYANSFGTAIAIGGGTGKNSQSTPNIAKASYASDDGAIAIGVGAVVSSNSGKKGSIALGAGATVLNQTGVMNIGTYDTSYGYSNSGYRLLTGLYDPQTAHDAATKGYCDARIINGGSTPPTTSTVGAVGTLYSTVESGTGHLYICTSDAGGTYTWQTLI